MTFSQLCDKLDRFQSIRLFLRACYKNGLAKEWIAAHGLEALNRFDWEAFGSPEASQEIGSRAAVSATFSESCLYLYCLLVSIVVVQLSPSLCGTAL